MSREARYRIRACRCIHLHACRRMEKIYREHDGTKGKYLTRTCDPDKCEAYQAVRQVAAVALDDALEVARDGCRLARDGYSDYSAVAPQDFPLGDYYELADFTNDKTLGGDCE